MDTTNTNTTGLMQAFDFEDNAVRVIVRDDQPWFVSADVCRVLGISNSRDAVSALDEDEKADVGITDIRSDLVSQRRRVSIVSESGLYALIFKSRKPEAKKFRKWITSEVIPAIRQTGSYHAEPKALPVRSELGQLRAVIFASIKAVQDKTLDVGRAQQIANLAAKYMEAVKIEADHLGYEAVLGLPRNEGRGRVLREQGAGAELLQAVPQREVQAAQGGEPDVQGEAAAVQEALGGSEPAEGEGARGEGEGESEGYFS